MQYENSFTRFEVKSKTQDYRRTQLNVYKYT